MYHNMRGHLSLASCLLLSFLLAMSNTQLHMEDTHTPDSHNLTENQGHLNQGHSYSDTDSDSILEEEKDKNKSNRQEYDDVTVEYFLDALMTKYGNGEDMSFEGFEHLLNKLKLANILFIDHHLDCHKSNTSSEFISFHSNHNHDHSQKEKFQASSDSQDNCPNHKSSHQINIHEQNSNKSESGHSHSSSGEEDHKHNHDHSGEVNNNVDEADNGHTHDADEQHHEHSQDHKGEENKDKSHDHEGKDDHGHSHGNEDDHDHSHDHDGGDNHGHGHDHEGEDDHGHSHGDEDDHDHSHDVDGGDNHGHSHDHEGEDDHGHSHGDEDDHDHSHDQEDGDNHGHSHDHEGEDDHSDSHDHEGEDDHDHSHEHEGKDDVGHSHDDDGEDDHNHSHKHNGEDDHNHNHEEDHEHSHDHEGEDDNGHSHDHNHIDDNGHGHDHEFEDDHKHESTKATPLKKIRKHRTTGDDTYSECLPPKMLLRLVNADGARGLTKEMFARLCPALIYQIEQDSCKTRQTSHDHLHDHDLQVSTSEETQSNNSLKVWGYSIVAVFIISLVGLVGVVLIPFMEKQFYNHLLQFLVALAIGAMSGDALLHLFPHAIAGGHGHEAGHGEGHEHGSHGDGTHKHDLEPVYKGLSGLLGIYFFFLTERILTIFTDIKRRKKQKKNRRHILARDGNLENVGKKLASNDTECDEMMMTICPNKALKGYADEAHTEHCDISFSDTTTITHQHENRNHHHSDDMDDEESGKMIIHNSNGHSHGHRHGHSHFMDGVPNSVSSIAWMVILGDGVHNFADGLAVGAAFSNSITGGFSTSIAVFCHELPHEIGDFAMLLRTGMSAKQAVIYSGISTLLCFAGLPVGIVLGNIEDASLWIFAIIAGMFLYIALVDMLPEMSSVDTKEGENPFFHLLLQLVGMLSGAGMMLVIALYEEDLKSVFH